MRARTGSARRAPQYRWPASICRALAAKRFWDGKARLVRAFFWSRGCKLLKYKSQAIPQSPAWPKMCMVGDMGLLRARVDKKCQGSAPMKKRIELGFTLIE